MKKLFLFILVLLGSVIVFSACSKRDTYADKLKKEGKAINRFIVDHDIKELRVFPEDSIFAENEYYKDANTGVYFRVISWGTGDTIRTPKPGEYAGTVVNLRVNNDNIFLVGNDTLIGNVGMPLEKIEFTYGTESTYLSNNSYALAYSLLSPGCALPLKYHLRNGGLVSLIIPFSSGSTYQQSYYEPLYLPQVRYTFYND